ncbi:STAS domain-containing protein [Streptomyces sp. NPDC057298]|uniref:STAS domain-containing protein n=1 Tax=Streptomyces sp. NPDC057298 TaxID=3346091 RepID=UPI003645D876
MTETHRAAQASQLTINHTTADGVRVVIVRGEIDHTVKDMLTEALLSSSLSPGGATPPRTVADLSGVTFMDSSGISVLILAHRAASSAQGWLHIADASHAVLRVLQIAGLDTVITCHPSIEQALTA